ncbi:helix-turn-helix domain-containing protein [Ligilactobacillus ceti]|uniref:HTH cro/C1-type domain-containing protein n=1 Tax=Ligilactobacillus ceti DSM 22408 TaxID=1122146 RepID=A0A0R2KH43_9LACO|nr:helix-turn-helix transcriptional regulator [Ligilactobacillus ceti]KRN88706.1 hypothetical protein IV53_GL000673 [Ligilactobacillus ceti DSM 22408]
MDREDREFTEYIKNKFYDNLYKASERFIEENKDTFDFDYLDLHTIGEIEMEDGEIKQIWIQEGSGNEIKYEIAFSTELIIYDGHRHYDDSVNEEKWLLLKCSSTLDDKLSTIKILSVEEFVSKSRLDNSLTQRLIPIIKNSEYEEIADKILNKYYPEALKYGTVISPQILATRLGLKIEERKIEKDDSILGRIYFEDTEANLYDEEKDDYTFTKIDKDTILVDTSVNPLLNIGRYYNTIYHECVHKILHQKIFEFQKILDEDVESICTIKVNGEISHTETHARKLAPKLHMPKNRIVRRANELIKELKYLNAAKYENEVMEEVISQLAQEFYASKQSVKIRLAELGFQSAIGTFTYVDNHYVKPHTFKKGSLKNNETYTANIKDIAFQSVINPRLKKQVEQGKYLFVDNHLVYNSKKYLQSTDDGLELTSYALSHMDECCIKFKLNIVKSKYISIDNVCFLSRSVDSLYTFEAVACDEQFENMSDEEQGQLLKNEIQEEMKIANELTNNPKQVIKRLLQWREMSQVELSSFSEIDTETISRIVNGKTNPKIETVVRLCLALKLSPTISTRVLDIFGCAINPNLFNHQVYRFALQTLYKHDFDDIKEKCKAMGVNI